MKLYLLNNTSDLKQNFLHLFILEATTSYNISYRKEVDSHLRNNSQKLVEFFS